MQVKNVSNALKTNKSFVELITPQLQCLMCNHRLKCNLQTVGDCKLCPDVNLFVLFSPGSLQVHHDNKGSAFLIDYLGQQVLANAFISCAGFFSPFNKGCYLKQGSKPFFKGQCYFDRIHSCSWDQTLVVPLATCTFCCILFIVCFILTLCYNDVVYISEISDVSNMKH